MTHQIYIDGGSRANPGPSALGVVFAAKSGKVIKEYSQYLGKATNNQAEYQALIFALKKAKALFGKAKVKKISFIINSDSELLVNQMKGEYKIKEPGIQKLFLEAWNLTIDFGIIDFVLIPRQENRFADRLVNSALDKKARSQKLL